MIGRQSSEFLRDVEREIDNVDARAKSLTEKAIPIERLRDDLQE